MSSFACGYSINYIKKYMQAKRIKFLVFYLNKVKNSQFREKERLILPLKRLRSC